MGNCLQCFQTSMTTSTTNTTTGAAATTTETATSIEQRTNAALEVSHNNSTCYTSIQNARHSATGHVVSNCTNPEGRYGAVGSGLGANNHSRHNFIYGQQSSQEKEELLASKSPLKFDSNCDTKRNSFKKSLNKPNAENSAIMSDVLINDSSLEVSDNALNMLFEAYKDPDVDMILTEGIERLCQDLDYQPDEFAILVLAWCLDASQMCQFTKAEFIEGLHKICADSIKTIRVRLEQTIDMLRVDMEMFKQLYRFTFRFGLDPDQRILSLEMAISLWKLVFTVHTPQILKDWVHFLEQHPSIRGIPKDTWNMFLNFSEQCDINNYDDTEAWPSLFDDFVDYEKMRLAGAEKDVDIIKTEENEQQSNDAKGRWVIENLADDEDDEVQDDDNNNDNTANTLSTTSSVNGLATATVGAGTTTIITPTKDNKNNILL